MINLIVENGSIVPFANTYANVETIQQYAAMRGVDLVAGSPVDEDKIAAMAINAMDFLESLEPKWKGERVDVNQSLSWPRKNVYLRYGDCTAYPSDEIPAALVRAQCQLCIYISTGVQLMPISNTAAFIKREKIGPIETEYSEALATSLGALPSMPLVDTLLYPLMREDAFSLKLVRV